MKNAEVSKPANLDDQKVFDALADAAKLYEQYVDATEIADLSQVWSETPAAPPPDAPLSLTIWRDK
jgi:hypothetical protein